MISQALGGSRK